MSLPATKSIDYAFARFAYMAGTLAAALGLLGILSWVIGAPSPQAYSYGLATMKMNTAVVLLLDGLAVALIARPASHGLAARLSRTFAGAGALIALITLAEYATGLNLGIDQLLVSQPEPHGDSPPGRMAPNTALCLSLVSTAILCVDSKHGSVRLGSQVASAMVLFIGFLALSGYFLSVNALYGVAGFTSMALTTAIAVTALAAGLLASRPDRGVAAILAQDNSTGAALRRFLPLLVAVPLLTAWLLRLGVVTGQFGADFSAALTATFSVGLLSALALSSARKQGDWENERMAADEQIRLAMEAAPNGMVIVDPQGRIALANAAIESLFGFPRAELIGAPVETLVPADLRAAHRRHRSDYQASQPQARSMAPAIRSLRATRKDGSMVPVEIGLNPLSLPQGDFVLATVFDVQQREQLERAAERERFFQLSNDALCIMDPAGNFVQVNPAFERILGYTREEMLVTPSATFVHPEDREATAREARKARSGGSVLDFRNRFRARDGTYRWLQWRSMPDQTGMSYATARDITQELEGTRALQAALEERNVLLQEVHHRVKNNLQIIASMINMQMRRLQPGHARNALEECVTRVQAISLIHATLYQSRDYARISFREYATSLVDNVCYALAEQAGAVAHRVDVAPLLLTIEKAIPCGLIINELVTNAFKHAFPYGRRGAVEVRMRDCGNGQLQLSVADDGIGLAANFEIGTSSAMGLTLVATLVEQLHGTLMITRGPGARFDITFPMDATP
jgi:PAS domain S-box-containing protein